MPRNVVLALWGEPGTTHRPRRDWRDWALVGVLAPIAVVEVAVRVDAGWWQAVALALGVVPLFSLLWRRTHPLLAVTVAFGAHALTDMAPLFDDPTESLYSAAFVLLLPYSLVRWGSGRESAIGIGVIIGTHAVSWWFHEVGVAELVFGNAILLLPAAMGATVRYESVSRSRRIDHIKSRERELLARELHDTVAHHVSAIAIRAQAGRAVAAADPGAALDALDVIGAEASRTLDEMRTMVGALRHGEEPELAPKPGVADLGCLARGTEDSPRVEVHLAGGLDDLPPSVDAAVYRLAQESVTNALRHARRATRVSVSVTIDADYVRLTVTDDGEATSANPEDSAGFGIVGMTERATLLGGTLHAGPLPDGGWSVAAVLPRRPATT